MNDEQRTICSRMKPKRSKGAPCEWQRGDLAALYEFFNLEEKDDQRKLLRELRDMSLEERNEIAAMVRAAAESIPERGEEDNATRQQNTQQ